MAKQKQKNDKEITPESLSKGKRIKRAIAYLTYMEVIDEQKDLVGIIGGHESTISNAANGKGNYPIGFIEKLVDKFDFFNRDYLMDGEGDLILTESSKNELTQAHELINLYRKSNKLYEENRDFRIKIDDLENEIAELKKLLNLPEEESESAEAV